jgi:two-component system NtrC family sensor kinase
VNALLQETAALQAYELERRDAAIDFRLDPSFPHILADSYCLQVVFMNLIDNALHALEDRHDRGTITIKTRRSLQSSSPLIIEFTDDGPGIPHHHLERIFEPFFSTRHAKGAAGLGLAVCQELIREQGGRISARSVMGQGSTFRIELPR